MTSKKNSDSIVPFRSRKKSKKECTEIEIIGIKRFQICSALDPYFGLPDGKILVTKNGKAPPIAFLFEIAFDILVHKGDGQTPISDELIIRKFATAYADRPNKRGCPEISTATLIGHIDLPYEMDFFKLFPAIQQRISEQIENSSELKMLFRKTLQTQ